MSEYSPYRRPSFPVPEKQEKLDKSADEASWLTLREIRCPRCNFPIMKVYSDAVGHVRPKCPKCKSKTIRLPHQIFHAILTLPCPT